MHEVFRAGVEPGGLTHDFEIKLLICYLLYKMDRPLTFSNITDVFVETALGNYFDVASATGLLVQNSHLELLEEQEKVFSLTELGRSTVVTLERTIPITAREKAVECCKKMLVKQKYKKIPNVKIEHFEDGYTIFLSIDDLGKQLFSMKLYVSTMEECVSIKKRFIDNPLELYQGMVALLSGNIEGIEKIFI